jgi:hypothetical protein
MPQFRVVLDDVELDERQHRQLDRALQKTTLQFLADVDNGGDRVAYYSPRIFRPPLAGIYIRKLAEAGVLDQFNEQVGIRESLKRLDEELGQGVDF